MPYENDDFDSGPSSPFSEFDRPVGSLVREKMRIQDSQDVFFMVEALVDQYRKLSRVVHEANSHFWEVLVDEGQDLPCPPSSCTRGSIEEAIQVLLQCKRTWQETEDAIDTIGHETARFTCVYHGPAAAVGAGDAQPTNPGITAEAVQMRRATGKTFPLRFKPPPPDPSPAELFPATAVGPSHVVRFVHRNNRKQALVYVDGACANNGQPNPRAGWAIVCGLSHLGGVSSPYIISGRLENKGPSGDESVATSNRAELRASIAALRLGDWRKEGFDRIVIATDSSYVVDGATAWVKGWVHNGWKTRTGGDVKNKDLWDLLLGEVERWDDQGLRVDLWRIPRELNKDADAAAKLASNDAAVADYRDTVTHSSQTTTVQNYPGHHRILTLCLDYEAMFDGVHGNLVSSIASKAKVERATNPNAALDMLNHEPPPSVILLADAALTRQRKVWERVIDRLREGATVVLAGLFSNMVNEGQFDRFFAKLNLGWKQGSYHRTIVRLCRGVVDSHLTSGLPAAYSQKGLLVKNVERSAVWYTTDDSRGEAAVVFAQVGKGRLGYIGDVNGEEATDKVVLAMCGL
ncbi:hypothetical protein BJ170DRAFT_624587 [Xylariales sp. AK1849]|nr:hypothetical protein BJ170DRAFT_624587 [Xylariales sp. AK1849]